LIQLYLLSIAYLLLGSAFLLSDSYGLSFPLLLSLRYAFRTHRVVRRILVLSGLLLTIALALFPMDPGPMLLGDLVPMLNVFSLTLWYLYQALRGIGVKQEEQQTVLDATGLYMERNKRNVGFLTMAVAIIHFIAPQLVLL
jgi:small-conductance mechanosensitive channel